MFTSEEFSDKDTTINSELPKIRLLWNDFKPREVNVVNRADADEQQVDLIQ